MLNDWYALCSVQLIMRLLIICQLSYLRTLYISSLNLVSPSEIYSLRTEILYHFDPSPWRNLSSALLWSHYSEVSVHLILYCGTVLIAKGKFRFITMFGLTSNPKCVWWMVCWFCPRQGAGHMARTILPTNWERNTLYAVNMRSPRLNLGHLIKTHNIFIQCS